MFHCKPCDKNLKRQDLLDRHLVSGSCKGNWHNAPSEKKCSTCKTPKPMSDYGNNSAHTWGKHNACKFCQETYRILRDYKITREEYDRRMATSEVCELCGGNKTLCHDHDHDTNDFRGVLCRSCNAALGKFGDNLEGIEKVIKYLKREV